MNKHEGDHTGHCVKLDKERRKNVIVGRAQEESLGIVRGNVVEVQSPANGKHKIQSRD